MPKQAHDDLFEGTSMSFGEHLEELRRCLFKALAGLIVTGIIGFVLANQVVNFFQKPLERAMENYQIQRAEKRLKKELGVTQLPLELKHTIRDRRLVPERLEVETEPLVYSLKQTFPEQLQQVNLSGHFFLPSDLKASGVKEFSRVLVEAAAAAETTPAKRVWMLLSEEQRKQVRTLAEQKEDAGEAEMRQLLSILNSVAGKRELHESTEFQPAKLVGEGAAPSSPPWWMFQSEADLDDPTIKNIRAGLEAKFDPEQSRRLNKLLLATHFPTVFEPPRVSLIHLAAWKSVHIRFLVLNAQEAFMIWMKAALVTGLVLGSPWIFYQIWQFVAAGLYPHEKNYVYLYLPVSLALFLGGASLAYLAVFDPVLAFLFQFNDIMNAEFDPRIGEWLSFVLLLPLGFGIGFQLPLVMLFLNRIGIVSVQLYIEQWRIAILSIFVIAMVLTPADPYSMLLMAIPLCLLYVVGILMCKWMPRGRNPFAEAYEP